MIASAIFILRFHAICAKITPRGSRESFIPHLPHAFHKG
jgi:hypothetical protein